MNRAMILLIMGLVSGGWGYIYSDPERALMLMLGAVIGLFVHWLVE